MSKIFLQLHAVEIFIVILSNNINYRGLSYRLFTFADLNLSMWSIIDTLMVILVS